jgi:hypothetical protein
MRRWILFGIIFTTLYSSQTHKYPSKKKSEIVQRINFTFSSKTLKFSAPLDSAAKSFPELNGYSIEIRRKHIGTMMAARPKPDFIFRKKENRKYVIFITDKPEMNPDSVYASMSYNAQLGVLGHELSHILDYRNKNNWQMLCFGINYVFNKKTIEAKTDLTAVKRGFGKELIEYTRYIHRSPHVNRRYLLKKKRFYLSASEIEENIMEVL